MLLCVSYGYDDKGRLNAVTDSNGTYNYSRVEDSNMIATTTHPNGLKRTRAYESKRNVVDYVQNDIEDTTVSKYDYTNDAAGKRTDVERTGTAFNQSDEISYDYNSRSEVTGAESTADDNYDYSYAYDNIGNRRSSGRDLTKSMTFNRDYTANNLNQYESVNNELELSTRWWGRTFDWKTEPDHDADGNMTYMPSWTGNWNLTWNAENRLVKAVSAYTKLEFTYDYKGRRIQKQVYTRDDSSDLWSLTSDLRYVYNGWNLIATTKTTDSSQPSSFAKASEDRQHTVKTYTWGLDLSGDLQGAGGVGGLLAVNINEVEAEPKSRPRRASGHQASSVQNPFFVSYDANGNVSEYIDGSGNIVAHYEYSPFGRLTAVTGDKPADFNHRFSTKYQNNETGLYYYGYRYYSAELGRWLSRDPIGERGGLNLYSFARGNPLVYIDAWGLATAALVQAREESPGLLQKMGRFIDDVNRRMLGASEEEWRQRKGARAFGKFKRLSSSSLNRSIRNISLKGAIQKGLRKGREGYQSLQGWWIRRNYEKFAELVKERRNQGHEIEPCPWADDDVVVERIGTADYKAISISQPNIQMVSLKSIATMSSVTGRPPPGAKSAGLEQGGGKVNYALMAASAASALEETPAKIHIRYHKRKNCFDCYEIVVRGWAERKGQTKPAKKVLEDWYNMLGKELPLDGQQ